MTDAEELKEPTCGDCKAFYKEARDENGVIRGLCMKRRELGEIPAGLEYCTHFSVRESRREFVKPAVFKPNKPSRSSSRSSGRTAMDFGPARATLTRPTTGDTEGEIAVDRDGLKQVLRELLEEETMYGYPAMAPKWHGGSLVLKPGNEDNQPREIDLDTFFHKIVMVRDRLRVLEAKLNASDGLNDQEKVDLQSYISKCYGTLTTFNVLFRDKDDHFSSK
ncbi:MAG: hypothetical protein JXX14_07070 [Deltaproteobacteria bacterium]|nr:hypothetical protein [Deltaproteobacteria bacterium]